jgi:hypothetical protein
MSAAIDAVVLNQSRGIAKPGSMEAHLGACATDAAASAEASVPEGAATATAPANPARNISRRENKFLPMTLLTREVD